MCGRGGGGDGVLTWTGRARFQTCPTQPPNSPPTSSTWQGRVKDEVVMRQQGGQGAGGNAHGRAVARVRRKREEDLLLQPGDCV